MRSEQIRRFFRDGAEFSGYFSGVWRGAGIHAHPGLSQHESVLMSVSGRKGEHLFEIALPLRDRDGYEKASYRIIASRWEIAADAADIRDDSIDVHLQAISEGEAYLIFKAADRDNHILFAGRIMRRKSFFSILAGILTMGVPSMKRSRF
jgi:hypothetical protein